MSTSAHTRTWRKRKGPIGPFSLPRRSQQGLLVGPLANLFKEGLKPNWSDEHEQGWPLSAAQLFEKTPRVCAIENPAVR